MTPTPTKKDFNGDSVKTRSLEIIQKAMMWLFGLLVVPWIIWVTTTSFRLLDFMDQGPRYSTEEAAADRELYVQTTKLRIQELRQELLLLIAGLPPKDTKDRIDKNTMLLQETRERIIGIEKDIQSLLRYLEKPPGEHP